VNFQINIFNSSPPSFLRLSRRPSRLHSARVPVSICSARPCGVGAGRRFCGATWMHGYPAVRGCGVDVVLVSCRRLLKYIIYEILHRKERKARAVGFFAPFAVRYYKLQPPPFFGSPAFTLAGCLYRSTPPCRP